MQPPATLDAMKNTMFISLSYLGKKPIFQGVQAFSVATAEHEHHNLHVMHRDNRLATH